MDTRTVGSQSVPVYILVRDRLRALQHLVEWLECAGHRIVFLDNASSYPPLLEYLKASRHEVRWLGENLGSRALWDAQMVPDEPFVLTDPDIVPTEDCPLDAVERLAELLARYPQAPKAGLGLYLDDVPATLPSMAWERDLVSPTRLIEPGAYDSLIDTTFALYRPSSQFVYQAIRTGSPYEARHLSPAWYGGELTEEDRYYLRHALAGPSGSSWKETLERSPVPKPFPDNPPNRAAGTVVKAQEPVSPEPEAPKEDSPATDTTDRQSPIEDTASPTPDSIGGRRGR